jgi:F-type H+-transporting ATPase subunit O
MFSALARTSTRAAKQGVRALSDSASHQPPISIFGTAARYANATYIAASKAGSLEKVESELAGLSKAAADSPAFAGFLDNPMISREEKSAQIEGLLKEKKVSQITTNLCTVMAGNAKLSDLPKVAEVYGSLMKAKRGEVDATITSADELTKAETNAIAAAIKATSKGASNVVISTQVDPSIIGGIQVQIGDQFLDLSVKSKIEEVARTPL